MSAPSTPARGTLRVVQDAAALARVGANLLAERAAASTGQFVVCLSGGHTPRALYGRLGDAPLSETVPWPRIQWIFGDERFVPEDDPASNAHMVRIAMFGRAPVPPANIHAVPTVGISIEDAVDAYETTLRSLATRPGPMIDLTFLGLGDDGHTASLIPGEPVLEERSKLVAAVGHGRPEPRVTLTFPALESSKFTVFLVSGEDKRAMLDHVLSGGTDVPAGMLRPQGELLWLVDAAAAGRWAPAA